MTAYQAVMLNELGFIHNYLSFKISTADVKYYTLENGTTAPQWTAALQM